MKVEAFAYDDGLRLVATGESGETAGYLSTPGDGVYDALQETGTLHTSWIVFSLTNGGVKTHEFATFLQEGDTGFRPRRVRVKGWRPAGLRRARSL